MYNQYYLNGRIEYNDKNHEEIKDCLINTFERRDLHLDIDNENVSLTAGIPTDDLEKVLERVCIDEDILNGVKIHLEGYETDVDNFESIFKIVVDLLFDEKDMRFNVDYWEEIECNKYNLEKLGFIDEANECNK